MTTKRKRGRPQGEAREKAFTTLLTPDQLDAVKREAAATGKSASSWAREVLVRAAGSGAERRGSFWKDPVRAAEAKARMSESQTARWANACVTVTWSDGRSEERMTRAEAAELIKVSQQTLAVYFSKGLGTVTKPMGQDLFVTLTRARLLTQPGVKLGRPPAKVDDRSIEDFDRGPHAY